MTASLYQRGSLGAARSTCAFIPVPVEQKSAHLKQGLCPMHGYFSAIKNSRNRVRCGRGGGRGKCVRASAAGREKRSYGSRAIENGRRTAGRPSGRLFGRGGRAEGRQFSPSPLAHRGGLHSPPPAPIRCRGCSSCYKR